MLQEIINAYPDELFLKADGFDEAIIGVEEDSMSLTYSVKKCIEILAQQMDQDEAMEFFDYNTKCAFTGDKTPIWCDDNF